MHASEQIGGRCVGHDVPRSCQADEVSPLSAVAFRGAGMRGPQRRARLGNKDSSASRVGRHLSGFLLRSQSLDGEVAHPTSLVFNDVFRRQTPAEVRRAHGPATGRGGISAVWIWHYCDVRVRLLFPSFSYSGNMNGGH
jgi:hypothetical protein